MIIGMNFIQVSGGANVFNFFVVALLFLGLFAGFHLGSLEKKLKESKSIFIKGSIVTFILLFVVLSVPRPLQDADLFLKSWTEGEEGVLIPQYELEALDYLRMNGAGGTVQSSPKNTHDFLKGPYVAYFSGHNSYYAAEIILQSHNQPVSDRPELVEAIFDGKDNELVVSQLDEANIKYLYMRINEEEVPSGWLGGPPSGLETFYQSDEVLILHRI